MCWLGLAEAPGTEDYFWTADGTAAGSKDAGWTGYTNWHKEEPNNYGGDEDAVFMNFWLHLGGRDPVAGRKNP